MTRAHREKKVRIVLWCFIIFVLYNHFIRSLPAGSLTAASFLEGGEGFYDTLYAAIIHPLDGFRVWMGDKISWVFDVLPQAVQPIASDIGRIIRMILGLHP